MKELEIPRNKTLLQSHNQILMSDSYFDNIFRENKRTAQDIF